MRRIPLAVAIKDAPPTQLHRLLPVSAAVAGTS